MVSVTANKGLAKKELKSERGKVVEEVSIVRETGLVKSLLHHIQNNPAAVKKAIELVKKVIPQMNDALGRLEKEKRVVEQQIRSKEKTLREYETYIIQKLSNYLPPNDIEEILKVLFEEEEKIKKGMILEVRNNQQLFVGRQPAGHFFKKHFSNARSLSRQESKIQVNVTGMMQQEKALVAEISFLVRKLPASKEELKQKIEAFLHLLGQEFHELFEFEWDVDEEEAKLLETGNYHLAALKYLQKRGGRGVKPLMAQLRQTVSKYQKGYTAQDISIDKKELAYMQQSEEVCVEGLKRVRLRDRFAKALLRQSPALRMIFDKKFRRYVITKAPKLAPVIVRAVATEGASLTRPADLAVLIDFAINDPDSPPWMKKWGNKILHSKAGEGAVKLLSGKITAKAA